MAKYSTGGSTTKDNSCQLCGETEESSLTEARIEGSTVTVCYSCAPDSVNREDNVPEDTKTDSVTPSTTTTSDPDSPTPQKDGAGESGYTIDNVGGGEWVENTDYGQAEVPYMQKNYGAKMRHEMDEQGLTLEDLAQELGVDINALEAIAEGNAISEEVGRDVISAVEDLLDIELTEDI